MRTCLRSSLLLATFPALLSLGCSSSSSAPSDTGTPVSTTVQRDMSPSVAAGDEAKLVTGNTDFAFLLYPGVETAAAGPNVFYSPYSVSLALAMTYAGAAGNTATQMATALRFALPATSLHPTFDALDLAIQAKPKAASGADGAPFAIRVADSLWGDQRVTFRQAFVDTLAANYGANLRTVDFVDQPTQAEAAINMWVSNETAGKINPLLGPGAITPATEFVIVNAVYFNAAWRSPFDTKQTQTGAFTRTDGTTVQAPRMSSDQVATAYAKGSNWQAVDLPYSGGTTSMVVVLPDEGAFAAVEQGLSGTFFSSVTGALSPTGVSLTMPRFKIHGPTISLVPQLEKLGMTDAFRPDVADFTAMIPAGGVSISDVLHQAFVDVDESGTEAAAATAVIGVGLAIENPNTIVDVNRAFFFFVRDLATNTVLFVGREGDPTAE